MKCVKSNWNIKKIKDFAEVITGGTPSTIKKEYWENGNIPWIPSGDLKDCKLYSAHKFISEDGLQNSAAKLMPRKTVLIALTGATTGQTAILEFEASANQSVTGILPSNEHIPEFLFYYLRTLREKVLSKSYGGAQKHICQGFVKEMTIPVPPLEIQKQIVSILERAEKLKELREQTNEDTNKLIQSIFYEMFGDPVKNEKGWVVENLENVCEKLFAGGDVPKNYFLKEKTEEFKVPIYSNGTDEKALYGFTNIEKVQKNSVTISARGTIGSPVIRKAPFYPIIRLIVATPKISKVNIYYFKEAISFLKFNKGGTSIPQLTVPMIKKNEILVPPIELQNKFARIVEQIELIREKQKQSTEDINQLFDALMQKAFNGELIK